MRAGPLVRAMAIAEGAILTVATLFMALAVVTMFFEAVSRSAFSVSHWWAEELVRFSVIWSVLLAAGVASRRGHFIRMDLLVNALGPRGRRLCAWLAALAGLAFCAALLHASIQSIQHLARIGMRTESNLDLPLWLVRLALPVGIAGYGLYFVAATVELARGGDPFAATAEERSMDAADGAGPPA